MALLLLQLEAAAAAQSTEDGLPWTCALPLRQLDLGIRGASNDRLLRFMSKLHEGQELTVVVLGGCFSMPGAHTWSELVSMCTYHGTEAMA